MRLVAKELQQEQGHALVESVQGLLTLIFLKLRLAMKEDVSKSLKNFLQSLHVSEKYNSRSLSLDCLGRLHQFGMW